MNNRTRRCVVSITAVAWAIWLSLYALSKINSEPSVLHLVALQASQMTAGMLTIVSVLAFLVCPVVATAQTWREIGIREQQKHCDQCPRSARAGRYSNIIPVHFNGTLSRSDN